MPTPADTVTLITCGSGAVGWAFARALRDKGHSVRVLIRNPIKRSLFAPGVEVVVGDLFDREALRRALDGVKRVIHIPPRIYPSGKRDAQLAAHRRFHLESTRLLVEEWRAGGARRLLYISSAHAGGRGDPGPLCEQENRRPPSPYAEAKREAEEMLISHARKGELDPFILRPPGIYGPGCKSLVTALLKAASRGIYLPLRRVPARRSLIFVGNLVEIGITLLEAENGPLPRILNVKDGRDYSAEELYGTCCRAVGKNPRLFRFPWSLGKVLSAAGKRIPGFRRLGILTQLYRSELYCDHLFRRFFPSLNLTGLKEALETFTLTSRPPVQNSLVKVEVASLRRTA